jgi:3-hydroxyacyl-[acyl-carrier-protein] dehydratase
VIGPAAIKKIIPHRHPLLLVDRVVEVEPGRRLLAVKAVTAAEPGYAWIGAAYPVGLLLESWAQAAVLLACWERPNPDVLSGNVALLAGVRDAQVLGPVHPGEAVEHEVQVLRDLGDTVILTGTSRVDGRPVLAVDRFTVALRAAGVLGPAAAPGTESTTTTTKEDDVRN